jgi:hypothetical protein
MLENSDFENGIEFNNNPNKKEYIKNIKIYTIELNKSIKRMRNKLPNNKNLKFILFSFFIGLLFFFLNLQNKKRMKIN